MELIDEPESKLPDIYFMIGTTQKKQPISEGQHRKSNQYQIRQPLEIDQEAPNVY